jgi:hypothetical protein
MTGKPIPSPASHEALELMKKAQTLLDRAEDIEKAMDKKMGLCPDCGGKMEKGNCMAKMGCGAMKADMKKGEQHKVQTFGTTPNATTFHIETGGDTYHQQYSTNNTLLDVEDIANKGASQSSVNMEALNKNQNPHDTPAPGHLTEG